MRTFFALLPDPECCLAIERWRQQCWPTLTRPVKPRNYHITLSFLGDITPVQFSGIQDTLNNYTCPPMEIALNDSGYWPDSDVLWLAPSSVPDALSALAHECTKTANRNNIRVSKKPFYPHVTIARRVSAPPALPPLSPLIDPDFIFRCDQLFLLQSVFDKSGIRYLDLATW